MKFDKDKLLIQAKPILVLLKRYGAFIFVVLFLGIYLFLVQYIGNLIQAEPTQSAVDSSVKPVSRLKIDQNAVKQMTDLEAQNIEVKSLFDQARENPFTE